MGKDRILVVDDDPDNRAMIGHFLTNWGYAVDDAKNGKVALEKVRANPPSLVLLDLEMPEMDGFETCEHLKTDPDTEWIPVIIFTGLEKMPHRIRGFRHGADDYVVKTVEPDELRTRIDLVLKRMKRYASLASGPVVAGETADSPEEETLSDNPELAVSVSLAKISFTEAVRLVLAHGKNGIATISNDGRNGTVHVHDGAVVHAATDEASGTEAFYELALWKNGRFDFQYVETGHEKTILTSTRSLLVEASRRFDAWNTISSKVRSFDLIPKWVPLEGADSLRLTCSDWAILRLVDGRRSIREIVEEMKTDIFEAGRVVYSLLTVGVLRLDESPDHRDEAFNLVPRRGEKVLIAEPFELSAAEWDVLSRADGQRTLGAIRDVMNVPPAVFMKLVRTLKDKGFLQFVQLVGREPRRQKGA